MHRPGPAVVEGWAVQFTPKTCRLVGALPWPILPVPAVLLALCRVVEQDRSMDLATLTAAERAGAAALAIQRMMGILHMGRASRVRVSCL